MKTLLKNGNILGEKGEFVPQSLLIEGEQIVQMATEIQEHGADKVYDLGGKLICPGFIDMHVHLREPGFEYKETIESGTLSAARGGFTTVACMPNTKPTLDSLEVIQFIRKRAAAHGSTRVLLIPCITKGMEGKELTDYEMYQKEGIFAISDDGRGVQDNEVMKEAFQKAKRFGLTVMQHCEFSHLSDGGAIHQGEIAKERGIKGIPSASEFKMIERDLEIVRETGTPYHVLHLSTAEAVELVRNAKAEGLPVTAEVTPHHLLLCDDNIPGQDTDFKMNPPLRAKRDQDAVIQGLVDGTIDFIATDHAPHSDKEKEQNIHCAPFGIIGSEFAFPLLYTHLVLKGILSLKEFIDKITIAPAKLFQLPWGVLAEGCSADITVIDLEQEQKIDIKQLNSKSRNTPFKDWPLKGWPVMTFYRGTKVWG